MKTLLFWVLLAANSSISQAQGAVAIYKSTVNSTVTIEAGNKMGSGFFVGDNLIVTNYHVISGATAAQCFTNESTQRYTIEGYLAFDKKMDLVLLKVAVLNRRAITLASAPVSPGQKIYVIGSPEGLSATISDGIVSGLRDFGGQDFIQITAPISPGSSGGPVLNEYGELVGVLAGQIEDGQNLNFAIPAASLEALMGRTSPRAKPLSGLEGAAPTTGLVYNPILSTGKTLGIGRTKSDAPGFSLDYFTRAGGHVVLFFTYRHQGGAVLGQTAWTRNFDLIDLIDLETGHAYKAQRVALPPINYPKVIYHGSEMKFSVRFDKIPLGFRRFSVTDGDCAGQVICFLDIDLEHCPERLSSALGAYDHTAGEGVVTFYSHYGKTGDIHIQIEGFNVGKLVHFFGDTAFSPECGQNGTLTIRLDQGTYHYTASDRKYSWKGTITVKENTCTRQGFAGYVEGG